MIKNSIWFNFGASNKLVSLLHLSYLNKWTCLVGVEFKITCLFLFKIFSFGSGIHFAFEVWPTCNWRCRSCVSLLPLHFFKETWYFFKSLVVFFLLFYLIFRKGSTLCFWKEVLIFSLSQKSLRKIPTQVFKVFKYFETMRIFVQECVEFILAIHNWIWESLGSLNWFWTRSQKDFFWW